VTRSGIGCNALLGGGTRRNELETPRIVCRFSCGAASAVATKLALAKYGDTHDVQIINAFVKEEDADNRRFLADCERWFGRPVTVLRDTRYGASTLEVFRQRRYMKGLSGAPCSKYLKRVLLDGWSQPGDVAVMGYDCSEVERYMDFRAHNPGVACEAPLIDNGLTKHDVLAMVARAGIELPLMYRLGYRNANCKGCVKGGERYWRAIREDFPADFEAVAAVQDEIGPGASFLRFRSGPRKGQRMSLRELPEGKTDRTEDFGSCSFYCHAAEAVIDPPPNSNSTTDRHLIPQPNPAA
jgi:hypothetical protein